jgi:hypothetical protein
MMPQLPNSKAFIAKQVLPQQFLKYDELQQVPTSAKRYTIQGCCLASRNKCLSSFKREATTMLGMYVFTLARKAEF